MKATISVMALDEPHWSVRVFETGQRVIENTHTMKGLKQGLLYLEGCKGFGVNRTIESSKAARR